MQGELTPWDAFHDECLGKLLETSLGTSLGARDFGTSLGTSRGHAKTWPTNYFHHPQWLGSGTYLNLFTTPPHISRDLARLGVSRPHIQYVRRAFELENGLSRFKILGVRGDCRSDKLWLIQNPLRRPKKKRVTHTQFSTIVELPSRTQQELSINNFFRIL